MGVKKLHLNFDLEIVNIWYSGPWNRFSIKATLHISFDYDDDDDDERC